MSKDFEVPFDLKGRRVWVAGHRGLVGGAISKRLESERCELIVAGRETMDFRDQRAVEDWMLRERPEAVFVAAAKVGGILANSTAPAEFIYDNLIIQTSIIHAAYRADVNKLLFLGSSCIYPKLAKQPISEDQLLAGPLEPTNEWYAIAKIAGIKLCQAHRLQYGCDFISAMPTNLYGPRDNFDLQTSHVIPALIRKTHEAKISRSPSVEIWGSGRPKREFLYIDDLADGVVFIMKHYSGHDQINVGTGLDITIRELAELTKKVVGFKGDLAFDSTKPDGTPRKLLDLSRLHKLGWRHQTSLEDGLRQSYDWFLKNEID